MQQPKECTDAKPDCAQWAADGECEKNREYMVGSERSVGQCRLSCGACKPGRQADAEVSR